MLPSRQDSKYGEHIIMSGESGPSHEHRLHRKEKVWHPCIGENRLEFDRLTRA